MTAGRPRRVACERAQLCPPFVEPTIQNRDVLEPEVIECEERPRGHHWLTVQHDVRCVRHAEILEQVLQGLTAGSSVLFPSLFSMMSMYDRSRVPGIRSSAGSPMCETRNTTRSGSLMLPGQPISRHDHAVLQRPHRHHTAVRSRRDDVCADADAQNPV